MNWRRMMFAVATADGARSGSLAKAVYLARACGAELELFQCVYDRAIVRRGRAGMRGVQRDIRGIVEQRHQLLEALAEPLRAEGLKVRTAAHWDEPADEGIIRQALRRKPDLLIAGPIRRFDAARLTLTRTDYRLIEACPCPLLLFRNARQFGRGNVIAAVDPSLAHGKPLDLDPLIIDAAGTLARALGAQLHVHHACRPWAKIMNASPELRRLPEPLKMEVHESYLKCTEAHILEVAARQGVPVDRVHLVEADVRDSLPRLATRLAVDAVAMGDVPRSRLSTAFVGHSSERVFDALDADLLIVKPLSFRCPVVSASVHRMPKGRARRARYVF